MTDIDVLVVGAGFAGLYQLHRLRDLGLRTRVIDAASDVGGTWYWNRYPGARCDVESMSYSYSFSPELEQDWTWTEKYPAQPEILAYLQHVADRFDLRRDITFDTSVTAASWADDGWRITTDAGERITSRWLIWATGCLSVPKDPQIDGLDDFGGRVLSTARWPHEGVDVTGERVAVVGTGSSGIQVTPVLAADAAELTVFQRTPSYSFPAFNRPLDADEIAERKATYPQWRDAQRASGFGVPVALPTRSALEVDPAERAATYRERWDSGVLTAVTSAYTDIRTNLEANETAAEFVRERIRETVTDPAVAETLSPRSYPLGTRRPCLDTGFYEAFNADHVHLVDARETPIQRATADGLRTRDGVTEVDTIVLATGFDAVTGALLAVDPVGRDGERLSEHWADGARSYLGLAVAGFPNMFTVTGPSSPNVLSNMVVSIEQHVDWITDAIARCEADGVATMEVEAAAEEAWVTQTAAMVDQTLYPRADSWYLGSNIPGKPRVHLAWVGGIAAYRDVCDAVAADDYRGFTRQRADPHSPSLRTPRPVSA
ncbi:NAD(P)/FAD-dependent oxidoreductase [Actinomycetospora sp. TBRC 11914]|uniref:flavin-containing monooxygenase n=1 Tax=Actinomycetospora sp. TBRC 11914 TaxID=2729387 RepID=UPI00145F6C3E|nr:NAD(P)/FAD-dependent oxidoreductase [Actinomycetospora sp. TBRC 11914]NMO88250.1 NAD(P)/FAD-dependent oxidoreductase [Actinomycetospora sp. TBRC 11914]